MTAAAGSSTAASGDSGTPLVKKLGIVAGSAVVAIDAPADHRDWIAPLPPGVTFANAVDRATDVVHVFCDRRAVLERHLVDLRHAIRLDAAVWVSWPKQAAKVPTDMTEDTVRAVALPLGYVDVKVCAVSAVWSGLKLVIRKELR